MPQREDTPTPRSRKPAALTVGSVALVGLVVVGWQATAALQRGDVEMFADPQALECRHGPVTLESESSSVVDTGPAVPSAVAADDLDCTLQVFVRNASRATVEVRQLTMPMLGPDARGAAEAVRLEDEQIVPLGGEVDAVFELSGTRRIEVDHVEAFRLAIAHRSDGCASPDSVTFHRTRFSVSVWGAAGEREMPTSAFAVVGSDETDCAPG